MKTSFAALFMVFCAIMVEKIMSRYLLIDMDQDQAPKQTEEESKFRGISELRGP